MTSDLFQQAQDELSTLRDLMRFAVSRFTEAKLFFGHGSDNAWDEAAYLLLHSLNLPLDRLDPDGCGQVCLAGARATNQHHVLSPVHELAAVQLSHQGLVHLAAAEVKACQVPVRR